MKHWLQYGEHVPSLLFSGCWTARLAKFALHVFAKIKREALMYEILNNVKPVCRLSTPISTKLYDYAQKHFIHETVNHMKEYVRGEVHTQRNRELLGHCSSAA